MSQVPNLEELLLPFPADEIEWRLAETGKKRDGGVWAKCFAYVTNRHIMDRLDKVLGSTGWKDEFRRGPNGGVLCGISIKVEGEWITKWDGAENTDIEAVKGGLSDAMKRAAVHWGLGRYLYQLDTGWAEILEEGSRDPDRKYGKTKDGTPFLWKPPRLPDWAIPAGSPMPKREAPKPANSDQSQPTPAIKTEPEPEAEPQHSPLGNDTPYDADTLSPALKAQVAFQHAPDQFTLDRYIVAAKAKFSGKMLTDLLAEAERRRKQLVAAEPNPFDGPPSATENGEPQEEGVFDELRDLLKNKLERASGPDAVERARKRIYEMSSGLKAPEKLRTAFCAMVDGMCDSHLDVMKKAPAHA